MLNRFGQLKNRIVNKIHYTFATIGGTIGTITGLNTTKTMCGLETSDKASYVISMGIMGTAVGYVSFIMFPIVVPLGLVTAVLIENLDNSKKDK
jgi:putative copper export protein